jgi:holin-like protein
MLEQIARVLFWLGCGEIISRLGLLPVPGPVIGLVLLYLDLIIRKRLPDDLGALADRVLQVLGMLFVPAGVGVVAYLDLLRTEIVPILAAVLGGTAITIFVTAIVAERFSVLAQRRREAQAAAEAEEEVGDVRI